MCVFCAGARRPPPQIDGVRLPTTKASEDKCFRISCGPRVLSPTVWARSSESRFMTSGVIRARHYWLLLRRLPPPYLSSFLLPFRSHSRRLLSASSRAGQGPERFRPAQAIMTGLSLFYCFFRFVWSPYCGTACSCPRTNLVCVIISRGHSETCGEFHLHPSFSSCMGTNRSC